MAELLNKSLTITIFGAGYVGISLALLFSKSNSVKIIDIDEKKVQKINSGNYLLKDEFIESYIQSNSLNISASLPDSSIYSDSDLFIVATPTDYSDATHSFDTSSVEKVVDDVLSANQNPNTLIVIKSTIPVGFTASINKKYKSNRILFSPEFLREGSSLEDSFYPSRIIVGGSHPMLDQFANLLNDSAIPKNIPKFTMDSSSAEAVKLFSNTYLAMRVSFFNELDSFAIDKGLNSKEIIMGVCSDSRIGNYYNNPSFGYGGYCLPKDTKQLLANYSNVPQNLIQAIVDANDTRHKYIANQILKANPKVIGIYKLAMKTGSDNYRSSSVIQVMQQFIDNEKEVFIYEPLLEGNSFNGAKVVKNFNDFKNDCEIILANRLSPSLLDVKEKIYTRDIFQNN
jgi:UDPglucose 6-dehydrogenase